MLRKITLTLKRLVVSLTLTTVSYTHLDVYKRQAHVLGNVREIEYLRDNKTAEKVDIRFQKV